MKLVLGTLGALAAVVSLPLWGVAFLGQPSDEPLSCEPQPSAYALSAGISGGSPNPCLPPDGGGGDPPPIVEDIDTLVARARAFAEASAAGLPDPFFGDVDYYRWCARLAARIHGHQSSGYLSADGQWRSYQVSGVAVTDGSPPPPGALLFYTSPPSGHVAVYLGGGLVVSNDVLDATKGRTGGVYIVETSELTDGAWQLPYAGWAPPQYADLAVGQS